MNNLKDTNDMIIKYYGVIFLLKNDIARYSVLMLTI